MGKSSRASEIHSEWVGDNNNSPDDPQWVAVVECLSLDGGVIAGVVDRWMGTGD